MISRESIESAKAEILRKTRVRLGQEDGRLALDALASGQYLDNAEYDQRGLFGTAATIRVLTGERQTDPATLELLARLNHYIVDRLDIERSTVSATEFIEFVNRRVQLQSGDVFRLADIGFAIAYVSPAVERRMEALGVVLAGLGAAARSPAGYSLGTEGGRPDVLATAHAVRCLAANNLPVRTEDWRLLYDALSDPPDIYIACFVIYVLACFGPKDKHRVLGQMWRQIFANLRNEFRLNAEANYEYTRMGQQDYVRVPWQMYLIQAAARLFPLTIFNSWAVQGKLQNLMTAVSSTRGLRYESSGPYLSTRTYACLYQLLVEIEEFNLSRPFPAFVTNSISRATRVLSSKAFKYAVVASMSVIALVSLAMWLSAARGAFSDLGPNLAAEFVLALALWAGMRLGRSR